MWERLKLAGLVVGVIFKVYFKILPPVALWLAIAWYFDISLVVALLVFIAVGMTGLGLAFTEYMAQSKDALHPKVKRDFYVVIDTNYNWNILKNSTRHRVEPDTLNSVYVFDSFEAAKAKFDAVSREHPFEDRPWLEYPKSHMDGSAYTEYEARLWVIPALSKQEAFDEAFYTDRRGLLGYGEGAHASNCVLFTDNDRRRQEYTTWWQERMDYKRYLDSRAWYLREHPDTTPEFPEPLDIEQWRSLDSEFWRERALPGYPASTGQGKGVTPPMATEPPSDLP